MTAVRLCPLEEVALLWVLSRGENVIPLPGMKRRGRLGKSLAAVEIVLTPDELARLDPAFPPGAAAGERTRRRSHGAGQQHWRIDT